MKPITNALAGSPAPAAKPAAPAPSSGFNAKPNRDQNQGASPAMTGDKQRIPRPAYPQIASAAPAPAAQRGQSYQASGIDSAMGALADKTHPVKRR